MARMLYGYLIGALIDTLSTSNRYGSPSAPVSLKRLAIWYRRGDTRSYASMSSRIAVGIWTAGSRSFRVSAAVAPATSSSRVPSTRPRRVLPAASNVASLKGVSGLFEIAGGCGTAAANIANASESTRARRISPPDPLWHSTTDDDDWD